MDIWLIIGIVIVGGGLYFLITNLPKKPKKAKVKKVSSGDSFDIDDDEEEELKEGVINTGKIAQVGEKHWVLNPKSPFPLTVFGINGEQAQQLKDLLDLRFNTTATEATRKLLPFIQETDVRCKEVDDYVRVFRPIFIQKMSEINTTATSWEEALPSSSSHEMDEFAQQVTSDLEMQLYCDVEALFRGHPKSKRSKEELIAKYGADIMKIYASMRKGINTVPYKPEIRKSLQRLEKLKLLAYGNDVNQKTLLKTLSIEKMKRLVGDLNYPEFKDKKHAYGIISKLPDLSQRLQTIVNFKTIYQKLPIPVDHKEYALTEKQKSAYLREFTSLLSTTYFRGGISIAEKKEFQGKSYSFVKGWEISAQKDACIFCKKQAEKKYAKDEYPSTPIHLGCRCTIITA